MLCVFVFLLSHCLENIFNDDEKEAGVGDVLLQSLVLRFFPYQSVHYLLQKRGAL